MKVSLIFVLIISFLVTKVDLSSRDDYWRRFKADFNKSYDSAIDDEIREQIFWNNIETIVYHNFAFRRNKTTFEMGINQFSDMTFTEYSEKFTPNETLRAKHNKASRGLRRKHEVWFQGPHDDENEEDFWKDEFLPASFDWRDRGAVTRVKDQKRCGACYAMAAVQALESHNFIINGKLIELSVQEIVDCPKDYHTFECVGGIDFRVFDYVKEQGGLSSASSYPYEARPGECRLKEKISLNLKGYGMVQWPTNDKLLKKAIVEIGPMMIAIETNHESFIRYSGGIYFEDRCISEINHSALLVGYGNENGVDYWIIKNSFGENWGENGYIRMAMNKGGDCGITMFPYFPVFHENYMQLRANKFIRLHNTERDDDDDEDDDEVDDDGGEDDW